MCRTVPARCSPNPPPQICPPEAVAGLLLIIPLALRARQRHPSSERLRGATADAQPLVLCAPAAGRLVAMQTGMTVACVLLRLLFSRPRPRGRGLGREGPQRIGVRAVRKAIKGFGNTVRIVCCRSQMPLARRSCGQGPRKLGGVPPLIPIQRLRDECFCVDECVWDSGSLGLELN